MIMMKNYIKVKINFDDRLPLNKTIENPSMIIVVRAVFHESNKYYLHDFWDECLYKNCRRGSRTTKLRRTTKKQKLFQKL